MNEPVRGSATSDDHASGGTLILTGDPIDLFFGEHRFLSNFWPAPVGLDGICYPTVEHAYQAAKTTDDRIRAAIRNCGRPGNAKAAGDEIEPPVDWPERSVVIMLDLLRQKFSTEPPGALLLGTGTRTLVEGNSWGDRFWGVCDGTGANHLGNLLMTVRAEHQGIERPVLAIDLEGTLVSNTNSLLARPGLDDFAEWCRTRFARMVIYTGLKDEDAREVLHRLAALDDIPFWFAETPILQQAGPCKDLRRVATDPWPVLLADDHLDAVCPDQVSQWIPVESWTTPYMSDDTELADVRGCLDDAISERAAAALGAREWRNLDS